MVGECIADDVHVKHTVLRNVNNAWITPRQNIHAYVQWLNSLLLPLPLPLPLPLLLLLIIIIIIPSNGRFFQVTWVSQFLLRSSSSTCPRRDPMGISKTEILWVGCPSCYPTICVKAVKGTQSTCSQSAVCQLE